MRRAGRARELPRCADRARRARAYLNTVNDQGDEGGDLMDADTNASFTTIELLAELRRALPGRARD